jgi:hypothetical protein
MKKDYQKVSDQFIKAYRELVKVSDECIKELGSIEFGVKEDDEIFFVCPRVEEMDGYGLARVKRVSYAEEESKEYGSTQILVETDMEEYEPQLLLGCELKEEVRLGILYYAQHPYVPHDDEDDEEE